MRRPLMWGCLMLVAIIALWMYMFGSPIRGEELFLPLDGKEVLVTGQVYQKEVRTSYGQEVLNLYLKSISIRDSENNELIGLNSDQSINSTKSFQRISKQIRRKVSRQKVICEIKLDGASEIPALGDYVKVSGTFTLFSYATNDGEFDSANYYGVLGVNGKVKKGQVENVKMIRALKSSFFPIRWKWAIREGLFHVKMHLKENLYQAFAKREASLLAKMLLGDGLELDSEIKDLYMRNGIVHILSISGLHISMLGMGVYKGLRQLTCPMKVAAVMGVLFILLYGGMTGFGVSVCRAVGMYGIHMLGELKGKTYDMPTAMGMLAFSMVLANPRYVYHSGFLLSFGSVAAIGCLLPVLNLKERGEIAVIKRGLVERIVLKLIGRKKMYWVINRYVGEENFLKWKEKKHKKKELRKSALIQGFHASLSVTVMTLPIQLYFFYQMPMYSVFLNMLVIPLMGLVMGVGIVGMLFPCIPMVQWVEGLVFDWYEWLCLMFEKFPGSIWITGRPATWKLIVYYCVLVIYVLLWRCCARNLRMSCGLKGDSYLRVGCRLQKSVKQPMTSSWKGMALRYFPLLVLIIFLGTNFSHSNAITFLDVGQGDCIVLETKEGSTFLVDCGSSSRSKVGENVLIPYLKYHGIARLDGVFLTHPDKDHMSGILELFSQQEIEVGVLYLPKVGEESKKEFLEIIEFAKGEKESIGISKRGDSATPIRYIEAGNCMKGKEFSITCLHPYEGYEGEGNEYSLCLLVDMTSLQGRNGQGTRILLTGDVEGKGEELLTEELIKRGIDTIDILKVSHHGSRNSTSEELLETIDVKCAVISCGENNSYGHPHEEILERLQEEGCLVLRTDIRGGIRVGF